MTTSVDAAFAAARAGEPDGMDREQLVAFVGQLAEVRAWCSAAEVRAARRSRQLATAGRAEAAAELLGRAGRQSGRDAKAAAEREEVCAAMPGFETALDEGTVSSGHLDAVANATRGLDDTTRGDFVGHAEALLDQAARTGVDTFERACRDLARTLRARGARGSDADELDRQRAAARVKRWTDKRTGMHHTHLELDPLRDAALWQVVNQRLATLRARDGNTGTAFMQLQVDAFVSAVGGGGGGSDRGERVPEIVALIDHRTLIAGLHEASVCETENGVPLPVSTVRRLCCEADVIPVVFGGDGEVLDAGRSQRTATRAQRRALRAMHRGCAHPGCTVGFDGCRIHHVRWWWEHFGPTNLDNLLPLCEGHHHLVHEGGWTLTMTPDRVATWRRPDGTVHHRGSTVDRIASPADRRPPARDAPPGGGTLRRREPTRRGDLAVPAAAS
jgi:hypothetical protein